MGLMYAWATKEYLLWNMTIGQIVMYHNKGVEVKYGKSTERRKSGLVDMTADELRKFRDDMKRQTMEAEEARKKELQQKYGDIG